MMNTMMFLQLQKPLKKFKCSNKEILYTHKVQMIKKMKCKEKVLTTKSNPCNPSIPRYARPGRSDTGQQRNGIMMSRTETNTMAKEIETEAHAGLPLLHRSTRAWLDEMEAGKRKEEEWEGKEKKKERAMKTVV